MKKNFAKIILILIFFIPLKSFGLDFELSSNSNNYQKDNQFYVDVFIDPEGSVINGASGSVVVSKNIKIVRIEDGGSIIKNWVNKQIVDNKINFLGIIPNGFGGYLNTNTENKKGLVFRIILEANRNGEAFIKIDNLFVTKNDGQGTTINPKSKTFNFVISNTGSNQKYTINDTEKPEISYELVSNPDLFNGQKALVFSVIDSKSGVANVFVKEGDNDFVAATSPYLLENQSFGSIILIKAIDNAGNITEAKVRSNIISHISAYFSSMLVKIILGLVILIILSAVFYAKNKNKSKTI